MRRIVIDGMNVIGSRPDGWWRNRDAAVLRLLARLQTYASLEPDLDVTLVLDGTPLGELPEGTHERIRVLYARTADLNTADDRIVGLLHDDADPAAIEVISSDRALRERVRAEGASVGSPRALLERLDSTVE